jgi:hypothetical protein
VWVIVFSLQPSVEPGWTFFVAVLAAYSVGWIERFGWNNQVSIQDIGWRQPIWMASIQYRVTFAGLFCLNPYWRCYRWFYYKKAIEVHNFHRL